MGPQVERVVAFVARRTGTALSAQQRDRLVQAITTRAALEGLDTYAALVEGPRGATELLHLISAIAVHKTDLFRDEGQLDDLRREVLEPLARSGRPLAVWSAGCATGEEVATLLVLLAEVGAATRATVLGSDLSLGAISRAQRLTFSAESMRRVPPSLRGRYFAPQEGDVWALVPALAGRARFVVHNLMDTPYPSLAGRDRFDLVVCRNVLIYLELEAARTVVGRLGEALEPDGTLVLSTTEPLLERRADLVTSAFGRTFFYTRPGSKLATQRGASATSSSSLPAVRPSAPPPTASAPRPSAPPAPAPPLRLTPEEEGRQLLALALEWASEGQAAEETLGGLRRALYLAPKLVAARYLVALIHERAGRTADAVAEYRRAGALLAAREADLSHSFLNAERLASAVERALARLGAL